MASADTGGSAVSSNFSLYLTPQQQSLIFAALNSDHSSTTAGNMSSGPAEGSPSGSNPHNGFKESPLLDSFDYDPGFDFDFSGVDDHAGVIGDMPEATRSESADGESPEREKRSHPEDDDPNGNETRKSAKRRESSDRVPKKPGRKPLTTEPTSKRKAQNRAAQRAFRERKERHLKDLETKVEELQKESEAANNENSSLRAQVEHMTSELNEYKQKLALVDGARPSSLRDVRNHHPFGAAVLSNLNDVNFQFEFPRFGMLPGPPPAPASASADKPTAKSPSPVSPMQQAAAAAPDATSPSPGGINGANVALFSAQFDTPRSQTKSSSRGESVDSGSSCTGAANTSSPSASSNSITGSSSCGTSPEPIVQSPTGFKPVDTLTTIGEEHQDSHGTSLGSLAGINFDTGFGWLAQHNKDEFNPELFGNWREPQDSIFSSSHYNDGFFAEAIDFTTPYNMAPQPPAPVQPKKSLIAEIDAQKDAYDDVFAPAEKGYNCHKIWEELQHCDKVQNGEVDIDGLCKELTQKAKCSGKGPEIQEKDLHNIMQKYIPKCADKDKKKQPGMASSTAGNPYQPQPSEKGAAGTATKTPTMAAGTTAGTATLA